MTTESHIAWQVAAGLGQICSFLRTSLWQDAEIQGLTPTQIQALVALDRRGPQRMQGIADLLGVTQPTASDAIAALIGKALVHKDRDPADGRAARVVLTDHGRAIAAADAAPPAALVAALDTLDAAALAALQRGLVMLIRALQVAGAIRPQRLCVTCRFFRPYAHTDAAAPHHCAFVDAAFGDAALRVDCGDHDEAGAAEQTAQWRRFASAGPGC